MDTFLTIEPSNLTLYTFLMIVVLSFLVMFFCGDNDEKTYQKIIGGLSVFVIALISENAFIFFTSLFIGGLIIASEKFLKSLAAILKTDSVAMPNTLAALDKGELSHASESEIKEEKKKEEEEVKEEEKKNAPQGHPVTRSERLTFADMRKTEEEIKQIITDKYKKCFTPDLKFENSYGQIVVDGVVHYSNDSGKINLDNVLTLVEIKYVHNPENGFLFESITRRVLERIRYLLVSKQVMVVFYSKNLTLETSEKINARLISLFSKDENQNDVVFGFVNLDEKLKPEVLKLNDLQPHVL